jgi:hypothetical protein
MSHKAPKPSEPLHPAKATPPENVGRQRLLDEYDRW